MNQNNSIQNLLSEWGKSQRLTRNDQTIKNSVLNSLPVNTSSQPPPSRTKKLWLPLGAITTAIFVIVAYGLTMNSARYSSHPNDTYNYSVGEESKNKGLSSESRNLNPSADKKPSSSALEQAAPSVESHGSNNSDDVFYPTPPPYGEAEIPVTDTRQFLKTDYSSTVKTRHAQEITSRIQTMVRGYDGRIDSANSSEKQGYIEFVIPTEKLESFRIELKQLVDARFTLEQTYTENLLPQKQVIEESMESSKARLTELTAQRDQLTASHNQTVASLESKISASNRKVANFQAQWNKASAEERPALESQISQTQKDRASLNNQLTNENNNFSYKLSGLNTQIDVVEKNIKSIEKQDTELLNTVATVKGNITVTGINIWQFIGFYLPDYWLAYILLIAVISAYLIYRNRITWEIK